MGDTTPQAATVSLPARRLALFAAGAVLAFPLAGCSDTVAARSPSVVESSSTSPATTTPLLSGTPYQEPLTKDAYVYRDWHNGGTSEVARIGEHDVDTVGVACVEYDGPQDGMWYELEGGPNSGKFISTSNAYNNGSGNIYDPYVPGCETNSVPLPPPTH